MKPIENHKIFQRSESIGKVRSREISVAKILKTYLNSFAIDEDDNFEIQIDGMKYFFCIFSVFRFDPFLSYNMLYLI